MGLQDRDYYRDDQPAGIQLGGDWSMVTRLIVVNVALFLLSAFIVDRGWLMEVMAASPRSITDPRWCWQLFTYGFAHSPGDIGHIFWNMFSLWLFGRAIEGLYGPKEFLRIYLTVIVLGGLVWAARAAMTVDPRLWQHYTMFGASGATTAITLLFCIHYPKQTIMLMMVLPVPAWVLGMMIIVGNIFGIANASTGIAFDVHLVGAAFAVGYYKLGWNMGRILPSFSIPKRLFKARPKLRVHAPDEQSFRDRDAEADELLEKVNREGYDSLSSREQKVLEDYSRRMRQKHR